MQDLERDVPWSVVLAGGEGSRLRHFTERWLGHHVPKQYCAFSGRQTMLEDALDRAERLSGAARTVTVVARDHLELANPILGSGKRGKAVIQPRNRDTAAGIFLALATVRKHAPDAVVLILPSDHFISPEDSFVAVAGAAAQAARALPDQLTLIGARPDSPEPDYGWVTMGREVANVDGRAVLAVEAFVEKPSEALASGLMAAGGLWNTFIMAASCELLWELGWRHVPEVMEIFERVEGEIGTLNERQALEAAYRHMPERNFSSAVLQNATRHVSVIELDGVVWSDWGRPERIASTLDKLGMPVAFPVREVLSAGPVS